MKRHSRYVMILGLTLLGCSSLKNGDEKKSSVILYKISGMPVRALNYKPNTQYIDDYEVLNTYAVGDNASVGLNKILSADSLTIKDIHRSCDFFPAYALKWVSGKVILISLLPCAKIQRINKPADGLLAVDDIKPHSQLENWVLKVASATK